jgi:uncharacterized protein (TIGR03067 family)
MNRATLSILAIFGVIGSVQADEKAELKALNGTWNIEKAVFQGGNSTELFKTAVLKMEDGNYTVTFDGKEDKGTLKIDAAKKPKQMTVSGKEGANKDKTYETIYELDGDTLKICYALEGKEPPKEFESKAGTNTLFIVYKRAKK